MLTLTNLSPRMLVVNLPHETACVDRCSCARALVGVTDYHPTGEKVVRAHKRRLAGSLTLISKGKPGSTLEGLPDSLAGCPEVVRAVKDGRLQVVHTGPAAPPPPDPDLTDDETDLTETPGGDHG